MAGHPNANRVGVCYVGQLNDVSSADNVVNAVASVLGSVFKITKIFYRVETGVTVGAVTTTLNWRPTPGSATGEKLIATWEQPVQAIDGYGYVELNTNANTATTIGAPSATSGYGIAGSYSNVGEDTADMICGPGGELEIDAPDGEAGAGAVEYWIQYEILSEANEAQTNTGVVVVPDVIGS